MSANAQLDGRIEWAGTLAALVAGVNASQFPHGTLSTTSDAGPVFWNATAQAWQPMVSAGGNYGVPDTSLGLWKPTGSGVLTFTGTLVAGATSATLNAGWGAPTGAYRVVLSSLQAVIALLTNGATTCAFYPYPENASGGWGTAQALTAAVTATATVYGVPPVVGVANYYSVSASIAAAGSAVLAATTPDVCRNVVGAWTGTAVATVTGTDYYGKPQTAVSALRHLAGDHQDLRFHQLHCDVGEVSDGGHLWYRQRARAAFPRKQRRAHSRVLQQCGRCRYLFVGRYHFTGHLFDRRSARHLRSGRYTQWAEVPDRRSIRQQIRNTSVGTIGVPSA